MTTTIYYFTGTGNSLAAAKKIAAGLEDCELVPIASLRNTLGDVTPQASRVGIIYPVQFWGLPEIVASFAGRLDLSHALYAFSVATQGSLGGSSALKQLNGILTKRQNRGLDAGFIVNMPVNSLYVNPPTGEKLGSVLAKADKKLTGIAGTIGRCEHRKLPYNPVMQMIHSVGHAWSISHNDDRSFTVNEKCISCGTCADICPVENIELTDGRPVWKHHCELCFGCIHLCPVKAIQRGSRTVKRPRYRNPAVSIGEFKAQTGKGN